jgi:hypothetical protein
MSYLTIEFQRKLLVFKREYAKNMHYAKNRITNLVDLRYAARLLRAETGHGSVRFVS